MENSQRDVLGERIRLLAHQLDISQVGDSVRSPDVPNQEDSNSMPALPNHNWAAGPNSGSEQNVSIRMDQSHMMANDQSNAGTMDELILIKPLVKKVIDERARKVKKCGNSEQQWYATERHKTPLVDLTEPDQPIRLQKSKKRVMTVQDLEDDPMDEPDTIQSDHSIQGSDSEWNEPGNRPPPSANKRRPYRHVPSPTHYRRRRRKKKRNESEASTQETLDSSSRADSDGDSSDDDSSDDRSDDSSDEAEDTEEVDTSFENAQPGPSRSKPVRSSNRTPQKKSRILNSSIDEDDDDDDDSSEEPVKQSLSRRISRDRKTPMKNSTRNSSKTITTAKRNLNNDPSSSRRPTFQIENDSFFDENQSAACNLNAELDGVSWIKHLTSLRTPFIPQINDEVFYSPGAHAKYCEEFEKKVGRLRVNERVPKEINKQNLMERLILCDVSSIEGML